MRKLSDYKDEEALEVLADLIDPVINIFGDKEVAAYYRAGVIIKALQIAIKNHKPDVMYLLAILEGVPVEEYHCNLLTLPKVLIDIFNDPLLMDFFTEQSEELNLGESSGSVTENTEEIEEIQNISSNM